MRGLTRLEFDGLVEAERVCLPWSRDRGDFTDAERQAIQGLVIRGLVEPYSCDKCSLLHPGLTPAGRMMLTLARTPESGIIQCDSSP